MRFNKTEGHIGVFHNPKTKLEFLAKFTHDGITYELKKCEGDNLINFWKDHGSHYENCVKRVKRAVKKKIMDKLREDRTKNFLSVEVQLGNQK